MSIKEMILSSHGSSEHSQLILILFFISGEDICREERKFISSAELYFLVLAEGNLCGPNLRYRSSTKG